MKTYIALLRGINSGMNPSQKMDNLRKLFEDAGFQNVRSVIASGNIIFDTDLQRKSLETKIEDFLLKETGVNTSTIVMSAEEIQRLTKADPFKAVGEKKTEKPNVTFFKKPPEKSKLPDGGKGFNGYGLFGNAYCYTVDMTSIKTPEAMLTLEKEFGKEITTRTWGTVLKICKLLSAG